MNNLITLLISITLFGCASQAQYVVIAPELLPSSRAYAQEKNIQFKVIDNRTANHIVQISRENNAARLMSPRESLTHTIEKTLSSAYKAQGVITTTSAAPLLLEIHIDEANIRVQQETLKYTAKNNISIRAKINDSTRTLTKIFTTRGNSNGPFNVDLAVLERDFNQQLSKLLGQIIENNDLQQFMRQK